EVDCNGITFLPALDSQTCPSKVLDKFGSHCFYPALVEVLIFAFYYDYPSKIFRCWMPDRQGWYESARERRCGVACILSPPTVVPLQSNYIANTANGKKRDLPRVGSAIDSGGFHFNRVDVTRQPQPNL